MTKTSQIDITNELDLVHGGRGRGAGRVAWNLIKRGGEVLEKIGGYAGGALALKEGWDYLRGNNKPQQAPAQQPAQKPAGP